MRARSPSMLFAPLVVYCNGHCLFAVRLLVLLACVFQGSYAYVTVAVWAGEESIELERGSLEVRKFLPFLNGKWILALS